MSLSRSKYGVTVRGYYYCFTFFFDDQVQYGWICFDNNADTNNTYVNSYRKRYFNRLDNMVVSLLNFFRVVWFFFYLFSFVFIYFFAFPSLYGLKLSYNSFFAILLLFFCLWGPLNFFMSFLGVLAQITTIVEAFYCKHFKIQYLPITNVVASRMLKHKSYINLKAKQI